ncbi:D-glycero-beta-D-manno-heptose 1-phosphate adenylyltransferase (EC / D-glycero-beta-D-manno-heptose-7-phosphate kinase (EC [Olavius algarvensis associated proteobacterium Delta 3]|nr:D-glycero-beta-D-manno-heptose 1-phosphate adenylyltransferase (EC / D-glycero-beta-D-manno-heptose-7-phosphate kinase (EC [Olavius algarvensis associated proteobacterium Delta 3]CAB5084753.1 D-glycero-beta-D-manno-heptose 1-phosphate adenylyltransferase (EC / D-glycero-beta-D-manno-heptose-7-phosphate kinase (EC [Olavius algarvensis associated proteobacterium Delta 3]
MSVEKILTAEQVVQRLRSHRKSGQSIVFTNGCFDLIHAGHVRYLTEAKALGDVLVIGLNSDNSVRRIKDSGRPLVAQDQRAEVLAGLSCVDYITFFDDPDPYELIRAVSPDILVKGADWEERDIIGGDLVTSSGGRVERIRLVPGISTSMIIRRILERYSGKTGPGE